MIGVFANTAAVIVGGLIGILFAGRIGEKYTKALMTGLSLIVMLIGIMNAIGTKDLLCVIICMLLGIIIGEALKIDDFIENLGDMIKRKLFKGKAANSRFTEGFVTSSLLFCIGSMAVMGSIAAGVNGDCDIFYAKSVLDFISSVAFGTAMGVGVVVSSVCVFVVEGTMTLLAGFIAPVLTAEAVREMSAVGGVILIGMAINLLGLRSERIKIANMLPAIFLPLAYIPIYNWIAGVIG